MSLFLSKLKAERAKAEAEAAKKKTGKTAKSEKTEGGGASSVPRSGDAGGSDRTPPAAA
jgi:hypothetical protein